MTEVNAMPIDVFVRTGYLSEINRRILNPLGLHLMAQIDDNGAARSLGPIVDRRDDPEGFTTDDPAQIAAMNAAAARVREIEDERREWREQRTGWWVQPVPTDDPQPEREEAQAIGVGEIAKHLFDPAQRIRKSRGESTGGRRAAALHRELCAYAEAGRGGAATQDGGAVAERHQDVTIRNRRFMSCGTDGSCAI